MYHIILDTFLISKETLDLDYLDIRYELLLGLGSLCLLLRQSFALRKGSHQVTAAPQVLQYYDYYYCYYYCYCYYITTAATATTTTTTAAATTTTTTATTITTTTATNDTHTNSNTTTTTTNDNSNH